MAHASMFPFLDRSRSQSNRFGCLVAGCDFHTFWCSKICCHLRTRNQCWCYCWCCYCTQSISKMPIFILCNIHAPLKKNNEEKFSPLLPAFCSAFLPLSIYSFIVATFNIHYKFIENKSVNYHKIFWHFGKRHTQWFVCFSFLHRTKHLASKQKKKNSKKNWLLNKVTARDHRYNSAIPSPLPEYEYVEMIVSKYVPKPDWFFFSFFFVDENGEVKSFFFFCTKMRTKLIFWLALCWERKRIMILMGK